MPPAAAAFEVFEIFFGRGLNVGFHLGDTGLHEVEIAARQEVGGGLSPEE